MSEKAKSLILIVIIIISLSFVGGTFYLLQKERAINLALQRDLEDTMVKYRKAESELEGTKKKISTLEVQLKEAQNRVDTLASEVQREKTAKQEVLTQAEQLAADLERQKGMFLDLENKLNLAQEDKQKILARLSELESQRSELEIKLKNFEQGQPAKGQLSKAEGGVELGTIVVAPESTSEQKEKNIPISGLEGKVLVVNKDYNFVVSNLGSKDGIEIGNILSVYHKNNYLGDVKIEKVHDSMSAAGFLSPDIKDKVSEGDKVVLKAK